MKDPKRSDLAGPQWVQEGSLTHPMVRNHTQMESANPKEVLGELFDLLEEYAPTWYTDEHHDRALSALRALRES
jgi:prephenate dehydrogenase